MMYGTVHQIFIQVMMSRKLLYWEDAKDLLREIASEVNSSNSPVVQYELQEVVNEINQRINRLRMKLQDTRCEVTGKLLLVLVVTAETPISRISSKYTPNELQLFQKIVDEIVTSTNGCALMNTCINLSCGLTEDMSKSGAEAVIGRFLQDHWFLEDKGTVYLGARCISELEPVLRDQYKDYIGECPLCEKIAIVGKKCKSCSACIHHHCYEKYRVRENGAARGDCLKCGSGRSDSPEDSE